MIIVYIDIILLVILLLLIVFTCCYYGYRVHTLRQNGQIALILKPTKVLFTHKKEGEADQLRTVVAYQNPLTGDYCVHKTRSPKGYVNNLEPVPDSPDSGVSDEYEPYNLVPTVEINSPGIHQNVRQVAGQNSELDLIIGSYSITLKDLWTNFVKTTRPHFHYNKT